MIKKKNIIALIPAKKNSNRLSEKNLKKIGRNKKKLIWFSINAALKSKYISNVIVSTDCNKIKSYAEKFGAKTPFMRSKKLCLNNTKMLDVIKHALTKIDNKDNKIDAVVLLQPTSPLRKTIETNDMYYYSRSRSKLWRKGETSGHFQKLYELRLDCDGDTLLALIEQTGAACHTGAESCFFKNLDDGKNGK